MIIKNPLPCWEACASLGAVRKGKTILSMSAAVSTGPLATRDTSLCRVFFCFLVVLMLAGGKSQAQSLSNTNQIISTTNQPVSISSLMPPLPPPPPPLVLTNPPPGTIPQFLSFSTHPTTVEITHARIFQEPLVPCDGAPSQDENDALANALVAFASRTNSDDFSALENFLDSDFGGNWYPSVLFNLGWEYYNTGYYSKALDAWEEDWYWLQDETGDPQKRLADRCLGELATMHSRIGDYQRLEEIFGQITNRVVTGPAVSLLAGSRQALWLMRNQPGISFRCGPLALRNISKMLHPSVDVDEIVEDSDSSTNGFSLAQLCQLSQQLKLNFQVAKRKPGSPMLLPCVVHWNVGHYAAILAQNGNRFFVADPTFGHSRWISEEALDQEASGYFLVPSGSLTNGWQSIGNAEAANVWGKGVTANSDPDCTTEYDEMANPSCDSPGMTTYNMQLLLVSLHLEDTPLSFTPPRGPTINFTVTYNQQEANQPAGFSYSNFGEKWNCNWISYVTDNGTNTAADVTYHVPGGGTETFTYDPSITNFDINWRDQGVLTRLSSSSYQVAFPDGSRDIFAESDGTVGNSRNIFLTQVIDPTGYTNNVNYDSTLRIVSVTDPQANATNLTFFYFASTNGLSPPLDPYLIQQVTDRYGRSAIFNYGNSSELQSITDVLGITSQFNYSENSDFIDALQTPYGTTTFTFGDDGNERWLEATDPEGATSRAEFNQSESTGIPNSDPGPLVPKGIYTRNYVMFGRNTFYWDKNAFAQAPGNYSKARIYHWLHNANLASAEGCLESIKEPLENRVWFNYPGQNPSSSGATIYGTQNLPSAVARVLDDGSSQVFYFYRNSVGKITNAVDPYGFSFTFVYATNQIDLLQVRQTTGTNNELDASFTYNSQHLPLTAVDASGQTNRFAYNAYGQITAITNPLSQVATFSYDTNGHLMSITGPTNGDATSFTYDSFDRVKTVTDPDGYAVSVAYDAFDRPVTNTYPDGSTETIAYKYLDPQTYVDRAGRVTQFTYDGLRHLTQISEATNWNTYLDWCPCGNLLSITDPLGRMTQWSYDIQGRVTSKQYPGGSTVKYGYESTTSRVKTFTNERNQTRTYSYFQNNWLSEVVYANPSITPTVEFSYDSYGRITQVYDGYGDAFDSNYNFVYEPITSPPTLGAGRLQTIVDPNGLDTLTYNYDALGRVQSVVMTNTLIGGIFGSDVYRNTYTYDNLGRVTQDATKAVGTFNFTYVGASSRLASIGYPSALTTTFGYYNTNGDLRLKGLTNSNGGTLLSRFNYAYNEEGQITNLVEQLGGGTPKTNQISYDAIGEVLSVTTNGNSGYTYTYDLAGNRTLETFGTNTWRARFNPINEIQSKDQGLSSTNRTYQWDEENRLVSVTAGSVGAKMIYNGFGRLVYLTEENNGTPSMYHWFVWDGDKIAEESYINTSDSAYFHWYYDYGHYDSYDPTYLWTTRDGLGSVREIYSGQYSLLAMQYDYDPYGRQSTLVSSYSTPPDIGFTGMFGIPGHNLNFAENRVYDPDTGRWLSRDPIGEAGGLNLYSYAANDPIDNVDPTGLCPQLGTILGEGQYRDINGDIRDENGDLLKDPLNPLNPINFEGGNIIGLDNVEKHVSDEMPLAIQRYFPPNNGFFGEPQRQFLMKGERIDRYGGNDMSRFFSPIDTPMSARSLPPNQMAQMLRTFEVVKPFEVQAGTVAPAFGQMGFGTQYRTPVPLKTLLDRGIIREIAQ
jgi:RHS repeat-associated protein